MCSFGTKFPAWPANICTPSLRITNITLSTVPLMLQVNTNTVLIKDVTTLVTTTNSPKIWYHYRVGNNRLGKFVQLLFMFHKLFIIHIRIVVNILSQTFRICYNSSILEGMISQPAQFHLFLLLTLLPTSGNKQTESESMFTLINYYIFSPWKALDQHGNLMWLTIIPFRTCSFK